MKRKILSLCLVGLFVTIPLVKPVNYNSDIDVSVSVQSLSLEEGDAEIQPKMSIASCQFDRRQVRSIQELSTRLFGEVEIYSVEYLCHLTVKGDTYV